MKRCVSGDLPVHDRRLDLKEFIKQRTVMNHGGAQFFCGGLVFGGVHRDFMRSAVVVDQVSVMHRNVCSALREAAWGKAACLHDHIDKFISFSDRSPWMIDEAGLHGVPLGYEAGAFLAGQLSNLELVDAMNPSLKVGFSFVSCFVFAQTVIVFGTEAVTESEGVFPAPVDYQSDNDGNGEEYYNDANDEGGALVVEIGRASCRERVYGLV